MTIMNDIAADCTTQAIAQCAGLLIETSRKKQRRKKLVNSFLKGFFNL